VRFILSPPPEAEDIMSQRSSQRLREKQIVKPTSPKEEEIKFGAASGWGSEQLGLLRVNFIKERSWDLNEELGIKEGDWPPEIQARMFQPTLRANYA
jgi:hypothetical protein